MDIVLDLYGKIRSKCNGRIWSPTVDSGLARRLSRVYFKRLEDILEEVV